MTDHNRPNILVVDDEERLRGLLRLYLENSGYLVAEAAGGREGLDTFRSGRFDLVVLDLMLPDLDGWTVCRSIREEGDVPIIMLTALGSESERLLGFDLGADDYVVKPFSPKELVSRVKALLRRASRARPEPTAIRHGPLEIDPGTRLVKVGDREISLTPIEYDLLVALASHPRQVFSRDKLLNDVWGYDYYGDPRTVDTHVKNLREKLGDLCRVIATVWGVGYRFEPPRGADG